MSIKLTLGNTLTKKPEDMEDMFDEGAFLLFQFKRRKQKIMWSYRLIKFKH